MTEQYRITSVGIAGGRWQVIINPVGSRDKKEKIVMTLSDEEVGRLIKGFGLKVWSELCFHEFELESKERILELIAIPVVDQTQQIQKP